MSGGPKKRYMFISGREHQRARADRAVRERDALLATVATVRALHLPYPMHDECEHDACDEAWEAGNGVYVCGDVTHHVCETCRDEDGTAMDWPCSTFNALGAALGATTTPEEPK